MKYLTHVKKNSLNPIVLIKNNPNRKSYLFDLFHREFNNIENDVGLKWLTSTNLLTKFFIRVYNFLKNDGISPFTIKIV